ncbi:Hypothetical predicted protein [Xyrichtys novacula]|uniref:Uncharacterized protein n=1 Tax=Xyrichtys novacula TaxID=13765 RepID=A0AAV1HLN2_XYRNO|nr:Hypothetical predicted protein [Xyrichtys novacula]
MRRLQTEQTLRLEKFAPVAAVAPTQASYTRDPPPTPTHTLTMCETHPGTYASDFEAVTPPDQHQVRCLSRCPEFLAAGDV